MPSDAITEILESNDFDLGDIPDDYPEKYTKPELRWRIKKAIQQSEKGGNAGQWSARKSQLLVQEYEARGGGYIGDEDDKDEAQQSLETWTNQDWQTASGSGDAEAGDHMSRYLPKDAWALLQDADRNKAEQTKQDVDEDGGQIADWPDVVLRTMTELGYADGEAGLTKEYLYDRAQELGVEGRSDMTKDQLKRAILDTYERTSNVETMTKDDLYDRAQELGIDGRSDMSKGELQDAVQEAERAG